MANFGIAFGAGVNSAIDAYGKGLALIKGTQDLREEMDQREKIGALPKVGDVVGPDGKPVDVEGPIKAEYQRLGIQGLNPDAPAAERATALNTIRQARGEQDNFALPQGSPYTEDQRRQAIAGILTSSTDPRRIIAGAQMGLMGEQTKHYALQNYETEMGNKLLAIRRGLEMGEIPEEEGRAQYVRLYNNNSHPGADGHTAMIEPGKGTEFSATRIGPDGKAVGTQKFKNTIEAIDHALDYLSPATMTAARKRWSDEKIAAGHDAATIRGHEISAGATAAAARDHRIASENNLKLQIAALAPLRDAQEAELRQKVAAGEYTLDHAKRLDATQKELFELAASDPSSPRLQLLAQQASALDKDHMVKMQVPDKDSPTGTREVLVNKYDHMLGKVTTPESITIMQMRKSLELAKTPEEVAAVWDGLRAMTAAMPNKQLGKSRLDTVTKALVAAGFSPPGTVAAPGAGRHTRGVPSPAGSTVPAAKFTLPPDPPKDRAGAAMTHPNLGIRPGWQTD